jgi:hypothetical protein
MQYRMCAQALKEPCMNTRYLITEFMKRLAPCTFGLLLIGTAPVAMAATSQYEQDVARCRSGESGQDVQACLKEARAARAAAGKLGDTVASSDRYEQNSTARCLALPEPKRQNCMMLMRSPARVYGSVEGGGVMREMVITVPASGQTGAVPPQPSAAPAPVYDNRSGVYVPVPMR